MAKKTDKKAELKPLPMTPMDIMREAVEATFNLADAKAGTGTASQHLHDFAKTCKDPADFKSQCKGAESWIKSEEGKAFGQKYEASFNGKIPNCWYQVKSDIYNAWAKFDLDPKDFDKPTQIKNAKLEAAKKADPNRAPTIKVDGIKLKEPLAKALSFIVHDLAMCNDLSEAGQKKAAKMLTSGYKDFSNGIAKVIKADKADKIKEETALQKAAKKLASKKGKGNAAATPA